MVSLALTDFANSFGGRAEVMMLTNSAADWRIRSIHFFESRKQERTKEMIYTCPIPHFTGHGEANFVGRSAMPHFAFLLVVLHGIEPVAKPIAPLIERGTGRDDFDEAETFFLENFGDGAGQLAHMERGPARDVNRARGLYEVGEIKCGLVGAVGRS